MDSNPSRVVGAGRMIVMPKAKEKPEPQFDGIVTVAVLTGIHPDIAAR